MAKNIVSHVMDLNKSGVTFTDSTFADIGSTAVSFRELKENIGHDFFTQEDLIIRTASGGGGTLLVETTDYVLSEEDALLSSEVTAAIGSTRHVYKKIQIINASYQTGSLYVSGKWIADGVDAAYFNAISPIVETKAAAYTITDGEGYKSYHVTTGTATKKIILPTVADNKNLKIRITKADTGYGPVMVDGEGSETINGLTHIFLWSKYDCIEMESIGTEWIITNDFKPYFYSGWISRSDWTAVKLGFATIVYDTLVGTFQIGDKITGASGSYGICIFQDATTLVLANCVSVGANVFANNEALSGDLSTATALVNMASGLKNVDSYVYHGWNKNLKSLSVKAWWSPDGAENTGLEIGIGDSRYDNTGNQDGVANIGVDTNNCYLGVGVNGWVYNLPAGQTRISNQDDFYNIFIKMLG